MIKLKEIPFGTPISDPDGTCIYTLGHVNADEFLIAVRAFESTDVPVEARQDLTATDIEFIRFRPMSPSELRANSLTWGVMKTDVGGYPVTAVIL